MEKQKSHEFNLKIVSITISLIIMVVIGMSIYQNVIA